MPSPDTRNPDCRGYLRLLAFECAGRDRMTNGTCHFDCVSAAAMASP